MRQVAAELSLILRPSETPRRTILNGNDPSRVTVVPLNPRKVQLHAPRDHRPNQIGRSCFSDVWHIDRRGLATAEEGLPTADGNSTKKAGLGRAKNYLT